MPKVFFDWASGEAQSSPRFRAAVDRLRQLAAGSERAGYARTTGPLTQKSWEDLSRTLPALLSQPQEERRHAWNNTDLPTDDGLRHLRDYQRGVRKTARQFIGTEDLAPRIHDLVATTGYQLEPVNATSPHAPTQAQASSLAAHITGASWGAGATALQAGWRRARPKDTFIL